MGDGRVGEVPMRCDGVEGRSKGGGKQIIGIPVDEIGKKTLRNETKEKGKREARFCRHEEISTLIFHDYLLRFSVVEEIEEENELKER